MEKNKKMIPLVLSVSLLLTLVLSKDSLKERVTNQQCETIRQRASLWKPLPTDPYHDADMVYYGIYIGNVCAAHNDTWLDQNGITLVISVASEWHSLPYEGKRLVEFSYYPMEDDLLGDINRLKKLWKEISYRMHNHLELDKENKVLVHCNMGISRSASVVLWYLQHLELITTPYATLEAMIKSKRPVITPNKLFRKILQSEDYSPLL